MVQYFSCQNASETRRTFTFSFEPIRLVEICVSNTSSGKLASKKFDTVQQRRNAFLFSRLQVAAHEIHRVYCDYFNDYIEPWAPASSEFDRHG